MRLLFVTQKLHGQDAFGVLWANAFAEAGYEVTVLCLEDRRADAAAMLGMAADALPFAVRSLGKEKGAGKVQQILTFWKEIATLKYDRVFLHMSPVWGLLGAWRWMLTGMPVYLWYTHYKMQLGLWLLGHYAKRMFCATPQSLPQYEGNPKKVVTGHGIDLTFWPKRLNTATDPKKLLCVHRLSRSKRLELVLHAMTKLPGYSLDIYGIDAERDYADEMRFLAKELGLSDRVTFHGTVPAKDLPALFTNHRLILNMASETIDKSMLEAMTCGCYPVTTMGNAKAIGLVAAPADDTPASIAAFVEAHAEVPPVDAATMYDIVATRHSLTSLIAKMDAYIRPGH